MKLQVKVIPKSSLNKVLPQEDGTLKVKLSAAPVDGKANEALCEILAKHFKVKKSAVNIKSGFESRTKIVEILL